MAKKRSMRSFCDKANNLAYALYYNLGIDEILDKNPKFDFIFNGHDIADFAVRGGDINMIEKFSKYTSQRIVL